MQYNCRVSSTMASSAAVGYYAILQEESTTQLILWSIHSFYWAGIALNKLLN